MGWLKLIEKQRLVCFRVQSQVLTIFRFIESKMQFYFEFQGKFHFHKLERMWFGQEVFFQIQR